MRISNYPTDALTGTELILATDIDVSNNKYKTVNFSVDTLKTFLVGTDDTSEFNNITLGGSLKFEGTANPHETTLSVTDPTADRTVTIPDVTGFVALYSVDPAGVTITSTPTELNKLDGFTGIVDDLNYAKDLRATGVTATEFNTLDGVNSTLTAAELNVLDGYTGTVTELNYLKSLYDTQVTNTEFDYLDIATLGDTEPNKVVTTDSNGRPNIVHSGGGTLNIVTSEATIVNGDALGRIHFVGRDANASGQVGAKIEAKAADTWSSSNLASTVLEFSTRNGSSLSAAMTMQADQHIVAAKSIRSEQFKLHSLNTAPSSATAAGTIGEIIVANDGIYICVTTGTAGNALWKKATLGSF